MKYLVLFVCFLSMVPGSWAVTQYRDFTSADGKTIKATVRAYDAQKKIVTIERDNKRTSKVPITIFSEADQAYILEWDASKGFSSATLLKISCDDKVVEKRKEKELEDIHYTSGVVTKDFEKTVTTFERIAYEIQFQNMNKSELKDIRMEYQIYYEQSEMVWAKKPEAKQKNFSGKMVVPTLAVKSKTMVTTESVEIHEDSVNPVPVAGGDQRRGGKGEVHGIRVRLYMKMSSGAEVMREFSSPEKLSDKKYPWKG